MRKRIVVLALATLCMLAGETPKAAAAPIAVSSVNTIADMQALGTTSSSYPLLYVQSYHSGTSYGGGYFAWDAVSTASTDGCTVFAATGVSTGRWVRHLNGQNLSVEMCGAYNDNTNSAATLGAFQAANDYVAASNAPTQPILMQGRSYNFGSGSTGVVKSSSFFCPNWIGSGTSGYGGGVGSVVTYTPTAEAAAFTFIGGSGAECGGGMRGVGFKGNANTIGVELRGQDGAEINISLVGAVKRAVLLHNTASGDFTEFDRITLTTNGEGIGTVLEYRADGGARGEQSFHGSGLVGGFINYCTSGVTATPAIVINSAAFPYNAPLTATFFPNATNCPILQNNNTAENYGEPWFWGNLSVEVPNENWDFTFGTGNYTLYAGTTEVVGNNYKVAMGRLYAVSTLRTYLNGQRSTVFQPINLQTTTKGGTGNLLTFPENGSWNNYRIVVQVTGANYNAFATADLLYTEGGAGHSISNQQNTVTNNTAGYGNIVLTPITAGLDISSSARAYPAGLKVVTTLTQIGQGSDHHDRQ